MLEESYISDKKISKSMSKLNRASSDKKFRVKSLRVKTQQKLPSGQSSLKKSVNFPSITKPNSILFQSPVKHHTMPLNTDLLLSNKLRVKSSVLQKNYEHELESRLDVPRNVVQQIFRLKLQNENIKPSQEKYHQFCKMMFLRLNDKVEISLEGFNLRKKALQSFLRFYLEWKSKNIIAVDLSLCSQLAYEVKTKKQQEQQIINSSSKKAITQPSHQQPLWPMNSIVTRLILQDQRLTKLSVRNMHISPQQMVDLLTNCLRSKRIYSLDISNKSSQSINRLGTHYYYLEAFFDKNQYIGVMKMDNLNVTDQCIQNMVNGMVKNITTQLKILSLNGNLLTEKSASSIFNLMTRTGLTELNLSNNPLTSSFYAQIKNLRGNTVKSLDLSSTNMDSQSLVHFIQQISENKSLQILKLDNNDFSHHWFNKTKDVFENGLSIQSLSMANCLIKNFDYLFEGITHSKYLKRLNLNYNLVNIQNQSIQKVANCLKSNKTLQQIRIRFCGYTENMLCQLLQGLRANRVLQLLDISQNHMSDHGGKLIVKILMQNNIIRQIGVQKLQFTVRMTEDIHKCINYNRQVRQKSEYIQLVDQNKVSKAKDVLSWFDIEKLSQQARRLQKIVVESKSRNQKIEQKIGKKKEHFMQVRKQYRQGEKKLERQIRTQELKSNALCSKLQAQISNIENKQKQILQSVQIQQNLIKGLEVKIMKQNQKIRKRQHQLEEQLRDEKYLQKRKQKQQREQAKLRQSGKTEHQIIIKKKNSNRVFDNTKGLQASSQRKQLSPRKKQ